MRLINCTTRQLEEFFDRNIPRYAILSHTWGDEEVSFADLPFDHSTMSRRAGYKKIEYTCQQARRDGLNYAWVDTCSINKSSSSELSEAINSMFTWYKNSARCYAYLSDVLEADMEENFPQSRWFTRGWTLQELLAPEDVTFYDREWVELGTKLEHAEWISETTGIDITALLGPTDIDGQPVGLGSFCVAKRMSWASNRETTRAEDMAYCLLGIFDVNMPLLYGEGDRAFLRLQEEIIRKIDDDSIFAWGLKPVMDHPLGLVPDTVRREMNNLLLLSEILASSPKAFRNCAHLEYAAESSSPFNLTNIGLQIQLPLVPVLPLNGPSDTDDDCKWIGLLSCSTGSSLEFLGILLCPMGRDEESSTQMSRAQLGSCRTVVVGSRAAARSVIKTITITGSNESQSVRGFNWGYRQIIVNESEALQDIGYRVTDGMGLNIAEPNRAWGYNPVWDAEKMILTIEGQRMSRDIIEFCFEPSWDEHNPIFSIFMHTASSRTIVREGDSFSEDVKRSFYDYLTQNSSQDDTGNVVIIDDDGNLFQVSIEIHAKKVYNHRLFEVNVDAVRVMSDV